MNEKPAMHEKIAALLLHSSGKERSVSDINDLISRNPKDIIDRLYSVLSVLDSKANGLLRINSLFVAGGIAVKTFSLNDVGLMASIFGLFSLFLLTVSCATCMSIVRIEWHFLEKAVIKEGIMNFEEEIRALSKVATARTKSYIRAWWLSGVGLSIFVVAFVFYLFPELVR
ncbi:MAG: hypothetical protein EPN26_13000 [Rhodospirillales bacterium]|nr:MAG: hypothetical protein EPN26_13000 [Rhodospirillales bacterium]